MSDPISNQPSIDELRGGFDQQLAAAITAGNVQPVRDCYLGRKDGLITRLLKDLGTVPPEERRERGASANRFKAYVEQKIEAASDAVRETAERKALERASLDVTLPGRQPRLGHRHPLTLVRDRMEAIFTRMGFAIVEGPEIEDERHKIGSASGRREGE